MDLVRTAISNRASFKFVVGELEKRPPSKAAAEAVTEVYGLGDAPPWLAAVLLGACRDKVGYDTVRGILLSAPGLGAESYAGVALFKIRGGEALDDLKWILLNAPDLRSREGAAYGLQALGCQEAGPAILEATLAGKVRWRTGSHILSHNLANQAMVLGLLLTGDMHQARIATEIIDSSILSAKSGMGTNSLVFRPVRKLLQAVDQALSDPRFTMAPGKRQRLNTWLGDMRARQMQINQRRD